MFGVMEHWSFAFLSVFIFLEADPDPGPDPPLLLPRSVSDGIPPSGSFLCFCIPFARCYVTLYGNTNLLAVKRSVLSGSGRLFTGSSSSSSCITHVYFLLVPVPNQTLLVSAPLIPDPSIKGPHLRDEELQQDWLGSLPDKEGDDDTCVGTIVDGLGSKPRITQDPEDAVVLRNEPVTLNCKAEGDPMPKVTWYKDGAPLELVPRRVQLKGGLFFLRVMQTRKESDAGVYFCQATNAFGVAKSKEANLSVASARLYWRQTFSLSIDCPTPPLIASCRRSSRRERHRSAPPSSLLLGSTPRHSRIYLPPTTTSDASDAPEGPLKVPCVVVGGLPQGLIWREAQAAQYPSEYGLP
ncbi:unnamed protein product [Cyprideis torosa]|uniref:Uncharacterized protein n=1 Tax=Cyprideis torosa TaxID=163714 RepID=A0A7R8W6I9_9CRUS|nr:unnamed protein product [Cyprideis torosa]CAG0881383.1 unnamed protein product [Cyprideis torosa]